MGKDYVFLRLIADHVPGALRGRLQMKRSQRFLREAKERGVAGSKLGLKLAAIRVFVLGFFVLGFGSC